MSSATVALFVAFSCLPAAAYVAPQAPSAQQLNHVSGAPSISVKDAPTFHPEPAADSSTSVGAIAASIGVGAIVGWLSTRRQQATSAAAAAVVALSPVAATAMVDYQDVQYLGGSDKVDINNATVQAYRQFPGMYPSAAGAICSHGPYNSVADIYNIPGLKEEVKAIIKKYEANLVCLPANPAYFLDRINNGMYR